jgi:hypothetical protein
MSTSNRRRSLAAALIALLAPGFALADSKTVTYTILKEGDPIGKESYVIDRDGDRTTVALTVDSAVHILFLDFKYHHTRTESWNGTTLEKLSADTDDDGSKYHVEISADAGGGYKVTTDGKAVTVSAEAFPLAQWNKAIVGHPVLIPVESDDSPYKVAFKDSGPDSLTIGGQKVDTEHYVLSGDVDRDLWYDSDGVLAKVTFRRRGFGIAIVRDN